VAGGPLERVGNIVHIGSTGAGLDCSMLCRLAVFGDGWIKYRSWSARPALMLGLTVPASLSAVADP
jgi:hypothetical protein